MIAPFLLPRFLFEKSFKNAYWKVPKAMHIEYVPPAVPVFMFDIGRQHAQQSRGKSKHSNKRRVKKKGNLVRGRKCSNLKRSWHQKEREATRTPKRFRENEKQLWAVPK